MDDRCRVNLDLSVDQTRFLEQYSDRSGLTKAGAIRKALELFCMAEKAKSDGLMVGAWGEIKGRQVERQFCYGID